MEIMQWKLQLRTVSKGRWWPCLRCGAQGWCPGTLGNISLFDFESKRVYIKRSGADLNRLELEDILALDLNGNVINGEGEPSIETNFHLVYIRLEKMSEQCFMFILLLLRPMQLLELRCLW